MSSAIPRPAPLAARSASEGARAALASAAVSLRTALRMFALYLAIPILLAIAVASLSAAVGWLRGDAPASLASDGRLIPWIVLVGGELSLFYVLLTAWQDLRGDREARRTHLGVIRAPWSYGAIGIGLGACLVAYPIGRSWWLPDAPEPPGTIFGGWIGAYEIVSMVSWTPIAEELLFRGYLLSAIRARAGAIGACVATTVLFLLMHTDQLLARWDAALPLVGLAAISIGLLRRSGSLVPGILAHAAYNLSIAIRLHV